MAFLVFNLWNIECYYQTFANASGWVWNDVKVGRLIYR